MIRSLRQRHRRMVIVLGVFLPIVFAVGIVARKPVPAVDSLPAGITSAIAHFESQEWQRADLFTMAPVQVRLMREHSSAGKFAVAFSAAKNFVKPDLLVYWAAGSPNITDTLPDNAILLGAFSSTPLLLPDELMQSNGRLVLFSLADNEVVDVSKVIRFNDSTK